jgi:hypothetical protein
MYRLPIIGIVGLVAAVPAADVAPPPRPVDVAAIVRQLGSEDFAEREAASRRLATLNVDEVPPELLAAFTSPDPEVRDRAGKAVTALREHIARAPERAALAQLPRGERFAKLGRIDLYVASTATPTDRKPEDPRLWLPAFEAGTRAVEKADMAGDRMPAGSPACFEDFRTYRSVNPRLRFIRTDGPYTRPGDGLWIYQDAIQAAGVTERVSLNALVVSRGPVRAGGIARALVLATGDVTSGDDLFSSVVICDGDVRVKGRVSSSLVIARGTITVGEFASASTLIAGGAVTIAKPRELVPNQGNPAQRAMAEAVKVVVEENVRRPLGYITFFELAEVGVEAKADLKVVRVTAVADGGAFARAGVKVGDVVAGVGGKKPDSPESLRRLLRDALALGDATVTLRRGAQTVTATVALPE